VPRSRNTLRIIVLLFCSVFSSTIDQEAVPLAIDGQESLTAERSSRLKQLEDVIETAEESVGKAIGEALLEIKESRLSRAEYGTFERYCESRWGYHRSYAYRLIAFAKATKAVSTNGYMETLCKNEGSFRAKQIAKKIGKRKAATIKPDQPSKVITSWTRNSKLFDQRLNVGGTDFPARTSAA
jgi:hypothetical protein